MLYKSIVVIILLLLVMSLSFKRGKFLYLSFAIILISIIMIVFSFSSMQDHVNYIYGFNDIESSLFEPGYRYFVYIVNSVVPNEYTLAATFLLIFNILVFAVKKNYFCLSLPLLINFQVGMISVRYLLAVLILSVILVNSIRIKRYLIFLSGVVFHYSTAVAALVLVGGERKKILILFSILVIMIVANIIFGNFIYALIEIIGIIGFDYSRYTVGDAGQDGTLTLLSLLKFVVPIAIGIIGFLLKGESTAYWTLIAMLAAFIKISFFELEPLSRVTNTLITLAFIGFWIAGGRFTKLLIISYLFVLNLSLLFLEENIIENTVTYFNEGVGNLF
jgi:hypothetical protein